MTIKICVFTRNTYRTKQPSNNKLLVCSLRKVVNSTRHKENILISTSNYTLWNQTMKLCALQNSPVLINNLIGHPDSLSFKSPVGGEGVLFCHIYTTMLQIHAASHSCVQFTPQV